MYKISPTRSIIAKSAILLQLGVALLLAFFLISCSDKQEFITGPQEFNGEMNSMLSQKTSALNVTTATSLGSAASFAVLGGTGDVTLTGSTVTGNVGHYPGTSAVILTGSTVIGTIDAPAVQAHNDFLLAYIAIEEIPIPTDPTRNLTGTLSGVTLTPGVYYFTAAAALTGTLTLDALGDPNAVWIFKIGTDGTGALTGTNFSVEMTNGAVACNVYWWAAEAATLTDSYMKGTILAGAAITFTRGSLFGRALAKADVTLTDISPFGGCGDIVPNVPSSCRDRVTGKGFIKLPAALNHKKHKSETKGTFTVSGGIKNNQFQGKLNYNDHSFKGLNVKGTSVTQYLVVDAVTRHIEGTAKVNGARGFTYKVDVSDNGKSGKYDTFAISLFNSSGVLIYNASGTLERGNIQLHKCKKDKPNKDDEDEEDDDDDEDDEEDDD